MTEEVYLGIDTSCYTTSLFFMDREGHAAAEPRRILKVKPGGCGLQQSEMLYQHTRNLPELMEEAARGHSFTVRGIGVSARPRPREDSYMPAFLAGLGFARSLAALYGRSVIRRTTWKQHCGLPTVPMRTAFSFDTHREEPQIGCWRRRKALLTN